MEDETRDALVGRIVADRYEVVRRIGKGGMGAIYEVVHRTLRRRFAMKVLVRELASNNEALGRFQREVDAIARLQHPNVVQVVGCETLAEGAPCMIMEFLEGEDLASRIDQRGPLAWQQIGEVARQVISALSAAHRAGIVHRDLKPQNIFLVDNGDGTEQVKLLDFGIAKVQDANVVLTSPAQLIGTPQYMAPEQIAGDGAKIGPWTDVWAFGTILFEMATGRAPFVADAVPMLLYKICHEAAPDIEKLRPDAPVGFARLVTRCLERSETQRIDLQGLRQGLDQMFAMGGSPARERPVAETDLSGTPPTHPIPNVANPARTTTLSSATGVKDRTTKTRSRWPAIVAASLVAAGAITWFAVMRNRDERERPAVAVAATPAAEMVTLEIVSDPPASNVYAEADGRLLGQTPFKTTLAAGAGQARFIVRNGSQHEVVSFDLDTSAQRKVTFEAPPLPAAVPAVTPAAKKPSPRPKPTVKAQPKPAMQGSQGGAGEWLLDK